MKAFLNVLFNVFFMVIIYSSCYAQVNKDMLGEYVFKSKFYYESITLNKDGRFTYYRSQEFAKTSINGNWQLRKDSLILDSYPQRDRLIVFETYKKGSKNKLIKVSNKKNRPINYSIAYITLKNDTVILRDQYKYSVLARSARAFYLIGSNNLVSPVYEIEGERSNDFLVLFETSKVFENESWLVSTNTIIPKNDSGKLQEYSLVKIK